MALPIKKKPKAKVQLDLPWENGEEEFKEKMDRFREGLQIDREALDDMLERHPQLYQEAQEAYVLAVSLRDERKTASDMEYANAGERVRAGFGSKEKPTVDQVKEGIAVDEDYLKSIASYQEHKKRADLLQTVVRSYESRMKALQEMCGLWAGGYFVLNSAKGAANKARAASAESIKEEMRKNRKPLLRRGEED